MNSRLGVRLARVKKRHKCKFVPRLLSMIVDGRLAVQIRLKGLVQIGLKCPNWGSGQLINLSFFFLFFLLMIRRVLLNPNGYHGSFSQTRYENPREMLGSKLLLLS